MNKEIYSVLKHYNLNDNQKDGIIQIWDFLSRFALVLAEDYHDQIQKNLRVNDFRLIQYKIVSTKMGNVKEIVGQREIPFRTLLFFNQHFTALGKASAFFNNQNKANGIKWLMETHLMKLHKWVLSDWVGYGLISHIHAIEANYNTPVNENKRLY